MAVVRRNGLREGNDEKQVCVNESQVIHVSRNLIEKGCVN